MLTCKKVSKTLAETDYDSLSWHKKLGLKLHVALCFVCGKFNRQVMVMQDTCRHYKQREEVVLNKQPGMADDQKDQLRAALAEQTSKSE